MNLSANPLISVVICTLNRAEHLDRALQSLFEQEIAGLGYEVIVVDNGSTDDSAGVCNRWSQQLPTLRYCREEQTGLSHARNRGWREALGEYVLYLDDDAKAGAGWLRIAAGIIHDRRPLAFGGPFYPFYLTPKPAWFKDEWGARSLGDSARDLGPGEDLSGGNMAVRRAALERVGGFDPELGVRGQHLAYGEETDLQIRLQQACPGEAIHYDPAMFILHLVRPEKMSLGWRVIDIIRRGQYHARLREVDRFATMRLTGALILLAGMVFQLMRIFLKGIVGRDHEKYPDFRSFLFDVGLRPLGIIGQLLAWRHLRRKGTT